MAKKAAKIAAISLAAIVAATHEKGFMFATPESVADLESAGLVETNAETINPDNSAEIAVRATAEGISSLSNETNTDAPAEASTGFAVISLPLPSVTRTRNGGSKYDFDKLEAPVDGQSQGFFVPGKSPKNLTSVISQANRRYGKVVGSRKVTLEGGKTIDRNEYEYTRKFGAVAHTHEGVEGSYVYRSA